MRRLLPALVLFGLLAAATFASAASATPAATIVKPSAMNGWAFFDDNGHGGSGQMVTGPDTAPLGSGSADLSVSASNQGYALGTAAYNGTRLDAITDLSYQSYQPGPTLAIALQFDVKLRPTDTHYDGRLVFEPYQNGNVVVGSGWQSWSPLDGNWWASHADPTAYPLGNTGNLCPIGAPCSWATILSDFPDATIGGNVVFKAGSGWSSFDGNVDDFTIGVNSVNTTYDFEPETPCTTVCYVDATNGNDSFGGDTASSAKKTIQAAIDAVSANGEVRVLPGHYQEEATDRSPVVLGGTYNFGLYIGPSKSGISIVGYDSTGTTAITDPTATLADITTVGDADFGPDGVFVEAPDVTFQGLTINGNLDPNTLTENDNKTFEIFADGFTLKDSATNVPGGGSVYFNDPNSVIDSYTILNNKFDDGTSIDITGYTGHGGGTVADRVIENNDFNLQGATYPGISFNGSGTTVPWFVGEVGGATISGNSFTGSSWYIRSRGTVDDAQFNWKSWFDNNTFDGAVMEGTDPASGVLNGYTYSVTSGSCPSNSCTFPNTKAIFSTIQGAVNVAASGDTVLIKADTYPEQVTVGANLTLTGTDQATTIIQAPTSMTAGPGGRYSIVALNNSANVTMSDLTVSGPGPSGCGSIHNGIFVYGGAYLNASNITVNSIRDEPLSGCQNGAGIAVGSDALSTTGSADLDHVTVTDYQKTGIVFDGASTTGSVTNSTVTGVGATDEIAQNGIQVSRGAVATVSDNEVSGNECDVPTAPCGDDFLNDTQSVGILLYNAAAGTQITGNDVHGNDVGIYNLGTSTILGNNVHANRYVNIGLDQGSATVTANTISGANTGVYAVEWSGDTGDTSGTLSNNYITGAADEAINAFDQDTGDGYVPALTIHNNSITGNAADVVTNVTGTVDASGNWWGSNSDATVSGAMTGNADFTPFLDVNTDTSGSAGFQGDFSTLHVSANGAQTGVTGRIQEAAGLLSGSPYRILAGPGTYNESDTLTTANVDLRGAQYGVSYNSRTFGGASESTLNGQLTLNEASIKVDGFSMENHVSINSSAIAIDVKTAGGGASITNNYISNVLADDVGGNQAHAEGIYLENGPSNVTIKNNKIDGVHGYVSSQAIYVGDSTATHASTGIDIENNTIKNVTADTKIAYGIQTNNAAGAGLTIKFNDIDTLTASWANSPASFAGVHAIAFEGPSTLADVEYNTIANLSSPSADQVAIFFELDAPITTATVYRNSVDVGTGAYGVANQLASTISATCNWWGAAAGPNTTSAKSGGNLTVAPWLIANDLINGDCTAISVHTDAGDATGPEGSTISTGGSFNGTISSITIAGDTLGGTFTPNVGAGTWTWSYATDDNFAAVGPITVTGHGTNGTTADDSFNASASNVAPTATELNAPTTQAYGTNFNISLNGATDVSSVDAGSLHYAFDCGSGYGSAIDYNSSSATNSASCPAPAQAHAHDSITVKGKVFDKDGGVSLERTASVQILQPEISLTPSDHNFDNVQTNTTSPTFTFTVKNVGTQDLSINDVSLGGTNPGYFGIDTNNCDGADLAANDTCTVLIFFAPGSTATARSARLDVDSNDPETTTASSTLEGTGTNPLGGSITIKLAAHPGGAQTFGFKGALGNFTLSDPSNNTFTMSEPAGSYMVQGKKVSGWSLLSLSCDHTATINKAKRKVTINLASGENITCTYTESKRLPDESIALTSNGTYTGVGVYANTAQPSQTLNQAIAVSQTKSFYVHLTNNSLDSDSFNVHSTLTGSTKFAVKFFYGATDITARVNAGTYNITLSAGQTITIQIQVRAVAGTPASATRNIDLTMKSKTSTSKDVVRGHVSRA